MDGVEQVALAAVPAMILEGLNEEEPHGRRCPRHHAHSAVSRTVAPALLRSHGTAPDDPGRRAKAATTIRWHGAALAKTNNQPDCVGNFARRPPG
jgi:hypothetical protein